MFNVEIEKYWKVLNMRFSKAEYLLKSEFPNLNIEHFGSNEQKVDIHFYISPKQNSQSHSSSEKPIILEITNDFLNREDINLFGIYSADNMTGMLKSVYTPGFMEMVRLYEDMTGDEAIKYEYELSDVKFLEALDLLYLKSSFADPVDLLCDYKFVMTPFGSRGSLVPMLSRTDFSIALKRVGVSETGKTTHNLLENLDDVMNRVIRELEKMR